MREYSLNISTSLWNAFRYALFTLILVPAAQKLWALAHSRRTGERVLHGRTARLLQSKLAYWALRQESDKESRLIRIATIAVCVLYIAGELTLEYGTGSKENFAMRNAVLLQSVRDDGGLKDNGVYFIDAGLVFGKPYGSISLGTGT